jgi:hypothetical protein
VWVTDGPAPGTPIQDSRRVSLAPDPSTTTQNLDWGHAEDYHAVTGTITGPAGLPDPRILIYLNPPRAKPLLLAQTGAQQCTGQDCSGYDWRLEHVQIDPRDLPGAPRGTRATVELTEAGVPIDSAVIPTP